MMKSNQETFFNRLLACFALNKRHSGKDVSARRLKLESLEDRNLLCAFPVSGSCDALDGEHLEMVACAAYLPTELGSIDFDVEEANLSSVDELLTKAQQDPNNLSENFIFNLSSNPNSTYTIYLDFNGNTLTGDYWNSVTGANNITTPAYSIDSDYRSFSNQELRNIYQIWLSVSEDYLPFDVNVTTKAPKPEQLMKSDPNDVEYGLRCCIGGSYADWYGGGASGISFVSSFDLETDTPNFVFSENCFSVKMVAEVVTHEVGHALGLAHHGQGADEYYAGANGWAPIMGAGYYEPLRNGRTVPIKTRRIADKTILP